MRTPSQPARLLFLCTGNYYRSRFAAILFNVLAAEVGLNWVADSRGLALERGADNIGPISTHALAGLAARSIPVEPPLRFPLPLQPEDLHASARVIALCEQEHRPLMIERFPPWADRVGYWQVDDVHTAEPTLALAEIERQIRALIDQLQDES
jgi:protein-tyrosine phosphatase